MIASAPSLRRCGSLAPVARFRVPLCEPLAQTADVVGTSYVRDTRVSARPEKAEYSVIEIRSVMGRRVRFGLLRCSLTVSKSMYL